MARWRTCPFLLCVNVSRVSCRDKKRTNLPLIRKGSQKCQCRVWCVHLNLNVILQPVGWKLRIPPQVLNTAQWGNHAGFLMLQDAT